jgi:hypothetical protein
MNALSAPPLPFSLGLLRVQCFLGYPTVLLRTSSFSEGPAPAMSCCV